jgi:predicted small secreted protein
MEKESNMNLKFNWFLKWGLILLIACLFANVLAGCNTMAGLGMDIHAAAAGIQDRMSEPDAPDATPMYTVRR